MMTTEMKQPRCKAGTAEDLVNKKQHKIRTETKILTIASLDTDGSFATGLFCLDKLPGFTIGPEFLLREGSANDQPVGLTSSPPAKH